MANKSVVGTSSIPTVKESTTTAATATTKQANAAIGSKPESKSGDSQPIPQGESQQELLQVKVHSDTSPSSTIAKDSEQKDAPIERPNPAFMNARSATLSDSKDLSPGGKDTAMTPNNKSSSSDFEEKSSNSAERRTDHGSNIVNSILMDQPQKTIQRSLFTTTATGMRLNERSSDRSNSPEQNPPELPNSTSNFRSKARSVRSRDDEMRPVARYLSAAMEGNLEAVKAILENELKVELVDVTDEYDDKKETALIYACMKAHPDVVEYLLGQGASLKYRNTAGGHATFFAAGAKGKGALRCLQLCIDNGGDITASTLRLRTPLWLSAFNGADETMAYIVGLEKVDLNKPNREGMTPLIIATINGHAKCVQLLINAKADLNMKMPNGWSAIAIAKVLHKTDCLHLLQAAHATDMDAPQFPMDRRFLHEKTIESQDVDEMKIQTMYKMVEECHVVIHGKEVSKKVLYLTNKQAVMFDEVAMERVVQALDIGEPKFVIQLLPSLGSGKIMLTAHSEHIGTKELEYGLTTSASSEVSPDDERVVETQLLLFMKTCVLPLAVQTKALIVVGGANDCTLSASLSKVVVAEQARLGKDCPFTVLATVTEREIHAKAIAANNPSLIAAQVARQSVAWQKRLKAMNEFYSNTMLVNALDLNPAAADVSKSATDLQQCDLTEAAERYIIFEGYEEGLDESEHGHLNDGPQNAFESVFMQYMTKKLPSIAIQCGYANRGFQFLVDLTTRNIPVLLLDTSERCITSAKFDPLMGPATKLAKASDSFPTITLEQFRKLQIHDGRLSDEGMEVLVNIAFEMVERKMNVLVNEGVVDNLRTSLFAFLHHVLTIGASLGSADGHDVVPLHERILEMEKFERTNKDVKKALVSPELVTRVLDFVYSRVAACDVQCQLSRVDKWLHKHDKKFQYMLADAVVYKKGLEKAVEVIDENGGYMTGQIFDSSVWMAQFDLLMSANTFSGSVFDLDEIKRVLGSVAKIDRLPSANSLEALRTLQDAWDHVEVYHFLADKYKQNSKAAYVAMLLTGIAITVLSQINSILGYDARYIIIALSFFGSCLAGFVAYTNPIVKWQQLRVAALTIESNIWMFRTRAGAYRTTGEEFDLSSEQLLADSLRAIKAGVLEGADIKSTSFFSRSVSHNKHGQHAPHHPTFGATDSFVQPHKKHAKKHAAESESQSQSEAGRLSGAGSKSTPNPSPVRKDAGQKGGRGPRLEDAHLSYAKLSDLSLPLSSAFTARGKADGDDDDEDGSDLDEHKVVALDVRKLRRSSNGSAIRLSDVLSTFRKQDDDSFRQHSQDSHYKPVQPDNFIRFRIIPVLTYYKQKLPEYSRWRAFTHTLLLLGSIASAILAIASLAVWAAIISVSTVSITAYQEFSGANSKMSRYSFTVHELQELIFWWCVPLHSLVSIA